ncbi:hypothetical protein [Corallococcus sp. 4LFB]|uniref:hypothetical protein n=1 Tax=Corallococcus sp. 4LFB TaxID=3383249 RepID=UPI0039764208
MPAAISSLYGKMKMRVSSVATTTASSTPSGYQRRAVLRSRHASTPDDSSITAVIQVKNRVAACTCGTNCM